MDPKTGGPAEALKNISRKLIDLGHHSDILSCDNPKEDFLVYQPNVRAAGPCNSNFMYCHALKQWLSKNVDNYDVVIVHGLWQYPGIAARKTAKQKNIPYYVFTHGMLDPYFNRASRIKMLKKYLFWPWQYRVLKDAKAVLFTAEEERILARKSFKPYSAREEIISYGAESPPTDHENQVRLFTESFPELSHKRFILFLGRLHPKKGCDLLIAAFSKVLKTDPALRLVIAGPGEKYYLDRLERLVRDYQITANVYFTGMLSGPCKWGAFRAAEAFALPSHQENFGIAVAEALACGTPVLITNQVNIWREVSEDRAGLVSRDDQAGIDQLLYTWSKLTSAERRTMSHNALECFANRFRIENTAENLVRLFTADRYVSSKTKNLV